MGGKLRAQNTDITSPDFSLTQTHKNPFALYEKPKPTPPSVQFSHPDDALYAEIESFTHAAPDNLRTVFAPLVVVKPFIRIKNNFTIGATTTQMIQNYTGKKMTSITYDMYVTMALQTSVGNFDIKYGKFSALNYSPKFSKVMPISNYFINAFTINAGHYFPRAIIATYTNGETSVSGGYAEYTSGLKFTGKDGAIVFVVQQDIGETFKFGWLVSIKKSHTVANMHIIYEPWYNIAFLVQVVNMGERPAFFGTCRYNMQNNKVALAITGFVQSDDGVRGGTVGLYHTSSGAYIAVGATYHDDVYLKNDDGTHNKNYEKFTPLIELGINRTIFPTPSR